MLADPAVRKSIPAGTEPTIRTALEIYEEGWDGTLRACNTFWHNPQQSRRSISQHHGGRPAPAATPAEAATCPAPTPR